MALVVGAGLGAAIALPLLPVAAQAGMRGVWSRCLLWALGVGLAVRGEAPRAGSLIVANHVSWLDVIALTVVCPETRFVCKHEIASWPALGWLLRQAGTFFMRRASAWSAWRTVHAIAPQLWRGSIAAVFPEGTTSDGNAVARFYPALFQAAVSARGTVQPVALSYGDGRGRRSYDAVYTGETSFGESLCTIAAASEVVLTVDLLPAFAAAGLTRRQAAERAHDLIASRICHVEVALPSYDEPMLRAA